MDNTSTQSPEQLRMHRRKFFGLAGVTAVALTLSQTACKKEDKDSQTLTGVNLGKDDEGLMNYAYAMEQVVTGFYQKLTSNPYAGMSSMEQNYWLNVRYHQETYRAFFKQNLRFNHIADLDIDVSGIDYSSRTAVLQAATEFANWQTQAYNGMAMLFENAANLELAAKIGSVKARLLATLLNWSNNGSYASGLDANGLDGAKSPADVLGFFRKYIKTPIDSGLLPTA